MVSSLFVELYIDSIHGLVCQDHAAAFVTLNTLMQSQFLTISDSDFVPFGRLRHHSDKDLKAPQQSPRPWKVLGDPLWGTS